MPKLIKNVNKLHKMWSVRAAGVSVLFAIQEALPIWEPIVPENVFLILSALASTGVIIGRSIDQNLGD